MLSNYMTGQKPVTVTLQNRVRVSGIIRSFDSYVVIIDAQRLEIVYRHAIASLAEASDDEAKRPAHQQKTEQVPIRQKSDKSERTRPAKPSHSMPMKEPSINSSMKEGLLKWMQGRKAAK